MWNFSGDKVVESRLFYLYRAVPRYFIPPPLFFVAMLTWTRGRECRTIFYYYVLVIILVVDSKC